MSAELRDILRTGFQRLENVDIFDRTRRTFKLVSVADEKHYRTGIFFRKPRRNYTHEAGIPAFVPKHNYFIGGFALLQFAFGACVQLVAILLAIEIVACKLSRQIENQIFVGGAEKFKRAACVAHSSCGVYFGGNTESERMRIYNVVFTEKLRVALARAVIDKL